MHIISVVEEMFCLITQHFKANDSGHVTSESQVKKSDTLPGIMDSDLSVGA